MSKVFLAVGHGVKPGGTYDPGASGSGLTEQSAGDVIVRAAASYLSARGVTVRHEAYQNDPNYIGTTAAANAWGADFVVEVHHDWSGAPIGAFGHWVSSAGKALADDIQQRVGDAGFPLRPDWHKRRTDLYILKNTNAPCVLYECGRIGQPGLRTRADLERMGRAIARGVLRHLGIAERFETQEEELLMDDAVKHAFNDLAAKLRDLQADVDASQKASSFREAIMITLLAGEDDRARELNNEAIARGLVTGLPKDWDIRLDI